MTSLHRPRCRTACSPISILSWNRRMIFQHKEYHRLLESCSHTQNQSFQPSRTHSSLSIPRTKLRSSFLVLLLELPRQFDLFLRHSHSSRHPPVHRPDETDLTEPFL